MLWAVRSYPGQGGRRRVGVGGVLKRGRWGMESLKVQEIGGGMGETREWEGYFEIPVVAGEFP